uniref:glutathione transferase n=1 Tax=Ananas comosus var. bracteatus TaxID=296719 RepID=A0A6V7PCW9_ANACO|nr:unnamed protein product [Ananas comosus var. bracteatus]
MGIKLYGMPLSYNTVRATAALNEKGLQFEFSLVDLRSGAHKQPPFLALNPFGQIPALEDGDTVLFESRAINRYIATKYKGTGPDLLPADLLAATEVWLEVESHHGEASGEAGKGAGRVRGTPGREQVPGGGEFTLADLNHLPCMHLLLKTSKADLITARPRVNAWWEDISSRPGWKKTAAGIPL